MVRFTEHANMQMAQRGVVESEVKVVLANPTETLVTRANSLVSYRQIEGKYIVVVHEHEEDDDLVITAMRVNRTRLERFGFTKV